jgi:hypothetical protein
MSSRTYPWSLVTQVLCNGNHVMGATGLIIPNVFNNVLSKMSKYVAIKLTERLSSSSVFCGNRVTTTGCFLPVNQTAMI